MSFAPPPQASVHRFTSHRRTITESDIVTFVNVVGLHEPFFIDMEYIREHMSEEHRRRFAPGPMIVSLGMGLIAPVVLGIIQKILAGTATGPFGGMTGIEARIKGALYPGDTIHVEGEGWIKGKTRRGYTLVDLRHVVKNQKDETIADFVETILFLPPAGVSAADKR